MKKWLKPILAIFICIAAVIGYNAYQQREAAQLAELQCANRIRTAQVLIMSILGYREYYAPSGLTYAEKNALVAENYEKFLARESLPHRLYYYKAILDEEYPKVGYGVEIPEITLERLHTEDPLVLDAELMDIGDKLRSEYDESSYQKGAIGFLDEISTRMKADGLEPYA